MMIKGILYMNAKKNILLYFCLSSLFIITSCASDPEMLQVKQGDEQLLSCDQLNREYLHALRAKQGARAEDRFMMKHMNPFSGFVSIYRMNKAEGLAEERMELVKKIMVDKKCQPPGPSYVNTTRHQPPTGMPGQFNPYASPNSGQPYRSPATPAYGGTPQAPGGTSEEFYYPSPDTHTPQSNGKFNPPAYHPSLLDKYDKLHPRDVYDDWPPQ
jgi:hypothetical protein